LFGKKDLNPWKATEESHVTSPGRVPGGGEGDEYLPFWVECGLHARQDGLGVNEMLEAILADNDIAFETLREPIYEGDAVVQAHAECSMSCSIERLLININSYDLACPGLTKRYRLIPKSASEVENGLVGQSLTKAGKYLL
jgi:hypothetical protein